MTIKKSSPKEAPVCMIIISLIPKLTLNKCKKDTHILHILILGTKRFDIPPLEIANYRHLVVIILLQLKYLSLQIMNLSARTSLSVSASLARPPTSRYSLLTYTKDKYQLIPKEKEEKRQSRNKETHITICPHFLRNCIHLSQTL